MEKLRRAQTSQRYKRFAAVVSDSAGIAIFAELSTPVLHSTIILVKA
jgi:hypothetical protein